MLRLRVFQVDAFTSEVFHGNPAVVCPLDDWLPDPVLQSIAAEGNLPATAFFVPIGDGYQIRWFSPMQEITLCGHATLASGYVLFECLGHQFAEVHFESPSGRLTVTRSGEMYTLDFPALAAQPCVVPEYLLEGLRVHPQTVLRSDAIPNYYAIYPDEQTVWDLRPNLDALSLLHPYGTVVSAPGTDHDIVSRYFVPSYGVAEDPVTGSIHCALAPYWAARLNKGVLRAHQASPRGGELLCEPREDRVLLSGSATRYLEGMVYLNSAHGAETF